VQVRRSSLDQFSERRHDLGRQREAGQVHPAGLDERNNVGLILTNAADSFSATSPLSNATRIPSLDIAVRTGDLYRDRNRAAWAVLTTMPG
jgi:hypothetical protein